MFLIMFSFIYSAQTETEYDPAQALIKYEEALKLKPTDKAILYKSGLCRQALNDYSGSINDFKGSLGGDVKDTVIYCDMAFSYIMLQQLTNALDAYNTAIKLDLRCAKAYLGRAMVNKVFSAKKTGIKIVEKPFDALSIGSDIDRAIKYNPGYAEAYYQRGLLKAESNKADKALVDLKKANSIGISYEDQKFEDAISISLAHYGDSIGFNPEKFVFIGDAVTNEEYIEKSKKYLDGMWDVYLTGDSSRKFKPIWYDNKNEKEIGILKINDGISKKEILRDLITNWEYTADIVMKQSYNRENYTTTVEEAGKVCGCKDVFRTYFADFYPIVRLDIIEYNIDVLYCFAKWEYLHAKASEKSFVWNIVRDIEFSKILPASIGMVMSNDELEKQENSKNMSLYEFHGIKTCEKKQGVLRFEGDGIGYNVEILAAGDFNNDNTEDLLVYVYKYYIGGHHGESSLYIMTRFKSDGMLSVVRNY